MGTSCIGRNRKSSYRPEATSVTSKQQSNAAAVDPTRSEELVLLFDPNLLLEEPAISNNSNLHPKGTYTPRALFSGKADVFQFLNGQYKQMHEECRQRDLPQIMEYFRAFPKNDWLENNPYDHIILQTEYFKWYAVTTLLPYLSDSKSELFHQDYNLRQESKDLLTRKFNLLDGSFKFKKFNEQGSIGTTASVMQEKRKSKYSAGQLSAGVYTMEGIFIQKLNYNGFVQACKRINNQRLEYLKDGKLSAYEVVAIYCGVAYLVRAPLLTRNPTAQIHTKPTSNRLRVIAVRIPAMDTQSMTFEEFQKQDASNLTKTLSSKYQDMSLVKHISKGGIRCLLLGETVSPRLAQNSRASLLLQIFAGQAQTVHNDVVFLLASDVEPQTQQGAKAFGKICKADNLNCQFIKDCCERYNTSITYLLDSRQNLSASALVILESMVLVESIKFVFWDKFEADQVGPFYTILKQLFSHQEYSSVRDKLYLHLTLVSALNTLNWNQETVLEILSIPKTKPIVFMDVLHSELGVDLDALTLTLRKDSNYLNHNPSHFRIIDLTADMQILHSLRLRDLVYSLLRQNSTELLSFEGRNIQIQLPSFLNQSLLPTLIRLQKWCFDVERLFGPVRTVEGNECHLLEPLLIKLAVEVFLKIPFSLTVKRIQLAFNSLVLCTPEIGISTLTLLGLSCELSDRSLSQHYYIRALNILHRAYCDPRSRGNTAHTWETFVVARLLNMKKALSKDLDIEYLSDLMESLILPAPSEQTCVDNKPLQILQFPFPTISTESQQIQNSRFTDSEDEQDLTTGHKMARTRSNGFSYYTNADLLEWILLNMPIFNQGSVKYMRSELARTDSSRSNISTESRSTNFNNSVNITRKQRNIGDILEKNEATISKQNRNFSGAVIFGNSKKLVSIYSPLRNLIVTKIACGLSHTIVSTLQSIWGWGDNDSQQLGPENGRHIRKMLQAPASLLSCGSEHSCAIIDGGVLKMWGQKQGGITCGDGHIFDQVACGGLHTVGLRAGQVYSWGRGEGGQLGIKVQLLETKKGAESTQYFLSKPTRIEGLERVKKVVCGDAHTLVLNQQGTVYVFGFAYQGQLGLGLTGQSSKYQIFEPEILTFFGDTKITDIAAGSTYSIFVTDKNEVYSCGLNDFHQIGLEKAVKVVEKRKQSRKSNSTNPLRRHNRSGYLQFSVPNKVDYFGDSFLIKNICCGENHSLAQVGFNEKEENLYIGWGMNKYNQLGIDYCRSTTPRTIPSLQKVNVVQMCCGSNYTMVIVGQKHEGKQSMRQLCQSSCKKYKESWKLQMNKLSVATHKN